MNKSAIELLKHTSETNQAAWIRQIDFTSYGVVVGVMGNGVVKVQQIIRRAAAKKYFTVPLVCLSDRHREDTSDPAIGDLVLVLALNSFSRPIFDDALARYATTGDYGYQDTAATMYSGFSAIGILLAPFKGKAFTTIRRWLDGDVPNVTESTSAKVSKVFRRELSLAFDAVPDAGGFVDRVIRMTFGKNSPLSIESWAKITLLMGEDADIEVTSQAGANISFQQAVVLQVGETFNLTVAGKLTVSSDDAIEVMSTASALLKFGNAVSTLGALIHSLANTLKTTDAMVVSGGSGAPAVGVINPAFVTALTSFIAQWDQVFE